MQTVCVKFFTEWVRFNIALSNFFSINTLVLISHVLMIGFNDQDIVCLSGAHALGRCHTNMSGYEGT